MSDSIATVTAGVAIKGTGTLKGTQGVAVTTVESGVPAGWPANPMSASCVDADGASNSNGTAAFGTLAGNTLAMAVARMLQGADIACSFVNTGIPNDGLQNGGEAGLPACASA